MPGWSSRATASASFWNRRSSSSPASRPALTIFSATGPVEADLAGLVDDAHAAAAQLAADLVVAEVADAWCRGPGRRRCLARGAGPSRAVVASGSPGAVGVADRRASAVGRLERPGGVVGLGRGRVRHRLSPACRPGRGRRWPARSAASSSSTRRRRAASPPQAAAR